MTIEMVRAFYHDILKKILLLEIEKKEIAQRILVLKSETDRLPLMRDFLQADLTKHQLLEQVTVSAMQNQVSEVLDQIGRFYSSTEGISQIECIRAEITRCESMLALVDKSIKHPQTCTFFERRILRDVNRLVVSQARYYSKTDF